MSEQITITLPDGSTREYEPGRRRGDVAASIGKRLAKAAVAAKVDGEWVDLDRPLDHDVAASRSSRRLRRRPRGAAALDRARDGPGGHATCSPGAKYAIGPAIADGFYYDFELPDGAALHRRRPRAHRGAHARDRQGRPSAFVRDELDYDDALDAVRRPALQARDHREGARRRRRRRRRGRGRRRRRRVASTATSRRRRRRRSSTCAAARTCRRPSGSARSS